MANGGEDIGDDEEKSRRIHIIIKAEDCPGFLSHLSSLPHGAEGPLIRAILFDWYSKQKNEGTLDSTVAAFLKSLNGKKRGRITTVAPIIGTKTRHSSTVMPAQSETRRTPTLETLPSASALSAPLGVGNSESQRSEERVEPENPSSESVVGEGKSDGTFANEDWDLVGATGNLFDISL
ncbi:hypothetical protein [Noviherbaspirillum malthae]|uniref:hypothetical protein n=1 Tax=Noviherbaspirillum malthae TaxID=1260987 RepID=UPI00188E1E33|nr:hypothetical protein [Noviherbaspirillum malthae]